MEAAISQGMTLSRERKVSLVHDSPGEVSSINLYGDNLRLQQILADFLVIALQFSPPDEGTVLLRVISRKQRIGTGVHVVHLEFRYFYILDYSSYVFLILFYLLLAFM